jgi:hypothetical protein
MEKRILVVKLGKWVEKTNIDLVIGNIEIKELIKYFCIKQ